MATPRKASIFSHLELPLPPEHLLSPTAEKGNPGLVANDLGVWAYGSSRALAREKRRQWFVATVRTGRSPRWEGGRWSERGLGLPSTPTLGHTFTRRLVFHLAHLSPGSLPCPPHPEMGWKLLGGGS